MRKEREDFTEGILRNCSGPGKNILIPDLFLQGIPRAA